jgi:hypothetical protein
MTFATKISSRFMRCTSRTWGPAGPRTLSENWSGVQRDEPAVVAATDDVGSAGQGTPVGQLHLDAAPAIEEVLLVAALHQPSAIA